MAVAHQRGALHLDRGAAVEDAVDHALERGAGGLVDDVEELVDAEPLGLADGPPGALLGDRVHELDAAAVVGGDDAVGDAPQRGGEPGLPDPQVALELLEPGDVGEGGDGAGDGPLRAEDGRGAPQEDAVGAVEALEVHLLGVDDLAAAQAPGHGPVAGLVGAAVRVEGAVLAPALHGEGGGAPRPDPLRGPVLQVDLAAGVADDDAVRAVAQHRLEQAAVRVDHGAEALDLAAQGLDVLLGDGGGGGVEGRELRGRRVQRLEGGDAPVDLGEDRTDQPLLLGRRRRLDHGGP